MEERLKRLREELEKGRLRLEALDRERQETRDTMLRIGGAIRVLEELQADEAARQPQLAHSNAA
jgi:hypothetical protein